MRRRRCEALLRESVLRPERPPQLSPRVGFPSPDTRLPGHAVHAPRVLFPGLSWAQAVRTVEGLEASRLSLWLDAEGSGSPHRGGRCAVCRSLPDISFHPEEVSSSQLGAGECRDPGPCCQTWRQQTKPMPPEMIPRPQSFLSPSWTHATPTSACLL